MDPDKTLEQIVEAIEFGNKDEAKSLIHDLVGWMNKKGFMPKMEFHTLDFLLSTLAEKL